MPFGTLDLSNTMMFWGDGFRLTVQRASMAIVPLLINHLAAKCIARVRFSVPTMLPESMRYGDGVDAGVLPPSRLVADPVQKPVMDATKRNRELIAHLAPEGARLHVFEVMRVARPAATDEAGLLGDVT